MFIGHLGLSYLISQSPRFWNKKLPWKEVIFLVFAGYALDLDLLTTGLNGVSHHDLATHTPFFALLLGVLFFILLRRYFSKVSLWLIFPILVGHLVLDEIGYWFYLLGWQAIISIPQINWFYPFVVSVGTNGLFEFSEVLKSYFFQAPANVTLEVILIVSTAIVFLRNTSIDNRRKND